MATPNFFIIFINPSKEATSSQVKEKLNLAIDWYRIKPDLWVVYSTSDEERWYSRLSSLVKPDGFVFICKLDLQHRQGWMKKDFWQWLRREQNNP